MTTNTNNKRGELGLEERLAFSDGRFFCTTADVWSKGTEAPQPKHWDKFWRPQRGVNVQVRNNANANGINTINPYKLTRDAIGETGAKAAKPKTTRSESTCSGPSAKPNQTSPKEMTRKNIWPYDILGMPAIKGMEIAHLLPAGTLVHEEWFGVGAAVMGLPKTATVREQLMATRGVLVEQEEDDNGSVDYENTATAKTKACKRKRKGRLTSGDPPRTKRRAMQEQAPSAAKATAVAKKAPPEAKKATPAVATAPAPATAHVRVTRSHQETPQSAAAIQNPETAPDAKPAASKKRSALKKAGSISEDDTRSMVSTVSFDRDSVGSDLPAARRVPKTGVVHFVSNKIRLSAQKEVLYGKTPVMLIVPCMSLESAKEWRGKKYEAVVLTGFPDGTTNIPDEYTEQYAGCSSEIISQKAFKKAGMDDMQFRNFYEQQKPRDQKKDLELVEDARQGLEEAVLGLTQYMKKMGRLDLRDLQTTNQQILQKRSKEFQALKEVIVPQPTNDNPTKPPLIVSFATSNAKTGKRHAAPDPLLLFAKAAVVWGKLTGTTILANGELSDDDYSDDLDEQAEEAFCESFFTHDIPKEISVVTPVDHSP